MRVVESKSGPSTGVQFFALDFLLDVFRDVVYDFHDGVVVRYEGYPRDPTKTGKRF